MASSTRPGRVRALVFVGLDAGIGGRRVCVGVSGYAWRPEQDSNLRPLAPEASALSAELSGQLGQFSRVSYIHAGR